jgi:hypothetical protein
MNEPRPTLVVFGVDPDGNPRAAKFTHESAELANKAASLLGYRVTLVGDPLIVGRLKLGNVFARGQDFIRPVKLAVFDKIVALSDRIGRLCALNDELRRYGRGGRIMMTSGIEALGAVAIARIMAEIASFDAFDADNDPYGEHDCAILTVDGTRVLFKIDYYDLDLAPSDLSVTRRVMTVMRADEY